MKLMYKYSEATHNKCLWGFAKKVNVKEKGVLPCQRN